MPQSLSQIYLHLVFSTKNRPPFIDEGIQNELYAYIAAVLHDECDSPARIIGGMEDHTHILLRLSRTQTVAHIVEMAKKRSSKWIKTRGEEYRDFQWQTGYGIFSVSVAAVDRVARYIANQRDHHQATSFEDEYRGFLKEQGIEYDERYVWD